MLLRYVSNTKTENPTRFYFKYQKGPFLAKQQIHHILAQLGASAAINTIMIYAHYASSLPYKYHESKDQSNKCGRVAEPAKLCKEKIRNMHPEQSG
jgi:hypothetical protein